RAIPAALAVPGRALAGLRQRHGLRDGGHGKRGEDGDGEVIRVNGLRSRLTLVVPPPGILVRRVGNGSDLDEVPESFAPIPGRLHLSETHRRLVRTLV